MGFARTAAEPIVDTFEEMSGAMQFMLRSSFWTGAGSVATSIAVVRALWDYRKNRHRQEIIRREEVFDKLDSSWREWLHLVLDHPELDLGDKPLESPPNLTAEQKVQREVLLHFLVSILEKAHLLYGSSEFARLPPDVRMRTNKVGWESYIDFWRNDSRLHDVDWSEFLSNYSPSFRDRMINGQK
jgi:hypothetical protein